MPSINLRLTEAEHEELRAWAFEGHRSIQREIVWRLFSGLSERDIEGRNRAAVSQASANDVAPSASPSAISRSESLDVVGVPLNASQGKTEETIVKPGKCQFNTPVGTHCKMCGKVHPL